MRNVFRLDRLHKLLFAILVAGAASATAATHTVNSTGDAGDTSSADGVCDTGNIVVISGQPSEPECTLRAAIEQVSAGDEIDFASAALVPDANGQIVIAPSSPLPQIDESMEIRGDTAPGYDSVDPWAVPVIVLDGQGLTSGDGLDVGTSASASRILGLAVVRFPGVGIRLASASEVQACHIGIDQGSVAAGNGSHGVLVETSPAAVVGQACSGQTCTGNGNVVSGNAADGIRIDAEASQIIGNRIGTDVAGAFAVPNLGYGITVESGRQHEIGYGQISSNLISGNQLGGVHVATGGVLPMFVSTVTAWGNLIGTDASGSLPIANGGPGVNIESDGVSILRGAVKYNAGAGVLVNGDENSVRSEIAFNDGPGVWIQSGDGNEVLSPPSPTTTDLAVHGNDGLPIDLGPLGPTPNDPDDLDTGANELLNHPEIDPVATVFDPIEEKLYVWWRMDGADQFTHSLRGWLYRENAEGPLTYMDAPGFNHYAESLHYSSVFLQGRGLQVGDSLVTRATKLGPLGLSFQFTTSELSDAIEVPEPSVGIGALVGAFAVALLARRTRR